MDPASLHAFIQSSRSASRENAFFVFLLIITHVISPVLCVLYSGDVDRYTVDQCGVVDRRNVIRHFQSVGYPARPPSSVRPPPRSGSSGPPRLPCVRARPAGVRPSVRAVRAGVRASPVVFGSSPDSSGGRIEGRRLYGPVPYGPSTCNEADVARGVRSGAMSTDRATDARRHGRAR